MEQGQHHEGVGMSDKWVGRVREKRHEPPKCDLAEANKEKRTCTCHRISEYEPMVGNI